jgi:hypothetical protein
LRRKPCSGRGNFDSLGPLEFEGNNGHG